MSLFKRWLVPIFALLMINACGQDPGISELDWGSQQKYDVTTDLFIESFDGTTLVAQLYKPKENYFSGLRPAIIFANSWTLDEKQYREQAKIFAQKGYIVLSYATRGFGRSGGVASAASPNDIKDVSSLIDWLEMYTRIDIKRLGMIGVSYGGGIGLLSLAQEDRLATAVALSGWADLEESLYGSETPRRVWINLLLKLGELRGHIDPQFYEMYQNLKDQTNVQETREWARLRSAARLVEAINKKGSPVMIANSYRDNLFPPNQARDFFEKLSVPKKFYMNRGIHASASIPGVFGLKNEIWDNVHDWIDEWLNYSSDQIYNDTSVPYTFQIGNKRESYAALPKAVSKSDRLVLHPVNDIQKTSEAFNFESDRDGFIIESGLDSGASTGIPILGSILDSHSPIKVKKWLPLVRQKYGAIYYTDKLNDSISLRGSAKVEFTAKPMSETIQVVAYLYEVNWSGLGNLVTHGVSTLRELTIGQDTPITIDLSMMAYDIPRGRKLAVVIDTFDALYDRPSSELFGFQVIHDDDSKLKLYIPEP